MDDTLREWDLDPKLPDLLIHAFHDLVADPEPVVEVVHPEDQLEIETRLPEGLEPHEWHPAHLGYDLGMGFGDSEKGGLHQVNIGSVGNPDLDVHLDMTVRFGEGDDLLVGKNVVRDNHQGMVGDIVESGGPHADLGYIVGDVPEDDGVVLLEVGFQDEEDPAEEIGKGVLGREGDHQSHDGHSPEKKCQVHAKIAEDDIEPDEEEDDGTDLREGGDQGMVYLGPHGGLGCELVHVEQGGIEDLVGGVDDGGEEHDPVDPIQHVHDL